MTRHQRAQVVELLRCAADVCVVDDGELWREALSFAHVGDFRIWEYAIAAAAKSGSSRRKHLKRNALLEAAQRVEEGSYP